MPSPDPFTLTSAWTQLAPAGFEAAQIQIGVGTVVIAQNPSAPGSNAGIAHGTGERFDVTANAADALWARGLTTGATVTVQY